MIDQRAFWQSVGQRASGSTIVTACSEHGPAGFLGLSATHLCADPPTMMVSVSKRTSALPAILDARHFALNFVPDDLIELADIFGGKTKISGSDRFKTVAWTKLVTGAPILERAVAAVDCELIEAITRFETEILLGRVVGLSDNPTLAPLVHFRGHYL
jgi:flavin reductase (DIM6/NTAB) family NADH-FMN oxidoreductase RutF